MLADELKEKLKAKEDDLSTIKRFYKERDIEARLETLKAQTNQEDFWKHPDQVKISQEYQRLKTLSKSYTTLTKSYEDIVDLIDLFTDDDTELQSIARDTDKFCKEITTFKLHLLLSGKYDSNNCFLTVNSGAGGTESQDWASMLMRMYLRFCEQAGIKAEVVDYQDGEEAGIKSATLHIKGTNSYGLLKSEHGIHRLVRISPFDSAKRRHTSFAGVFLTAEVEDAEIVIQDDDLRIDTYRAGGAGGQHVNRTDSAVRITHLPTGIVVQCQNERSQPQNKAHAMKQLMSKLVEKREQEKREAEGKVEKKKIEWGSQIRSYVLHPYKMVKDHRTDVESPQPEKILDGEITPFIEGYLVWAPQEEKES
jgi:peptide chain release factor 2